MASSHGPAVNKLVELAVAGTPDPDWDEQKHPRDAKGQFVKTVKGIFLWGKTKKATYNLSGKLYKIDVKPGDKVYSLYSPIHGKSYPVVDSPSTHTYTSYQEKPHEVAPNSPLGKAIDPDKETPAGYKVKLLHEQKAVPVDAQTLDVAKAKINQTEGKTHVKVGGSSAGHQHVEVLEPNQIAYKVAITGSSSEATENTSGMTIIATDNQVAEVYDSMGNEVPQDQWATTEDSGSVEKYKWQERLDTYLKNPSIEDDFKPIAYGKVPPAILDPSVDKINIGSGKTVEVAAGETLWKSNDVYVLQKPDGSAWMLDSNDNDPFAKPYGPVSPSVWESVKDQYVSIHHKPSTITFHPLHGLGEVTTEDGKKTYWLNDTTAFTLFPGDKLYKEKPAFGSNYVVVKPLYDENGPTGGTNIYWMNPETGNLKETVSQSTWNGIKEDYDLELDYPLPNSLKPEKAPEPDSGVPSYLEVAPGGIVTFTHPKSGQTAAFGPMIKVWQKKSNPDIFLFGTDSDEPAYKIANYDGSISSPIMNDGPISTYNGFTEGDYKLVFDGKEFVHSHGAQATANTAPEPKAKTAAAKKAQSATMAAKVAVKKGPKPYLSGSIFTHPVSGAKTNLGKDKSLYQHKVSKKTFIVTKDGTTGTVYDSKGNSAHFTKSLKFQHVLTSNYDLVAGPGLVKATEKAPATKPAYITKEFKNGSASLTHPVSKKVTKVPAGYSVYEHKLIPGQFLITKDGEEGTYIDKNGAAKEASALKHLNYLGSNYNLKYGPGVMDVWTPVGITGAPKPKPSEAPVAPAVWIDPEDVERKIKVGDWLATKKNADGSDMWVLLHIDGLGVCFYSGGHSVYVDTKAQYKKNGWTTVWEKPLPTVDVGEPEKILTSIDETNTYMKESLDRIAPFMQVEWDYYSWNAVHQYDENGNYDYTKSLWAPTYQDPSFHGKLEVLADPDFQEVLSQTIATLATAKNKKWASDADTADKTKWTKTRTRAETMLAVSHLASLLLDQNSDPQEVEDWYEFVTTKLDKTSWGKTSWSKTNDTAAFPTPYSNVDNFVGYLNKGYKDWTWKHSLKGLDFDPETADLTTLASYAGEHGFPYSGALSKEKAQQWVLADLGSPLIGNPEGVKEKILKDAKTELVLSKASEFLKQEQAKPANSKVTEAKEKALKAQEKAANLVYQNMYKQYTMSVSDKSFDAKLTWVGPDQWVYSGEFHNSSDSTLTVPDVQFTSKQALGTIEGGGWEPNKLTDKVSGDISYKSALDLFEQDHGAIGYLDTFTVDNIVVQRGMHYSAGASTAQKMRWLKASLAGDQNRMYQLEKVAAEGYGQYAASELDDHPGNPNTPQGKASRQMIADMLVSRPWWPQEITLGGGNSGEQAFSSMHLDETGLVKAWADIHPDHCLMNHEVVDNPADMRQVLARWIKAQGPLPVPSQVAATSQVPEDLSTPEGIDEKAWALVISAEKGVSEVTDFVSAEKPEKFTNSTIPGNAVGPSMAQFIPTQVKKLALWARKGYYGGDENQQNTLAALKFRIKQGAYVPVGVPTWKHPGSGKVIPLAPGSKVIKNPEATEVYYITQKHGQTITVNYDGSENYYDPPQGYQEYPKVLALPDTATYEQAKADGLIADEASWKSVEDAEKDKAATLTYQGTENLDQNALVYTLKHGGTVPPTIKANPTKLPLSVQRLAVWAKEHEAEGVLAAIEYKLKAGHFFDLGLAQILDPKSNYAQKVMNGQTLLADFENNWSFDQMQALGADLGIKIDVGGAADAKVLYDVLQNLFTGEIDKGAPVGTPKKLNLTADPYTNKGGIHTKHWWLDQNGDQWMSKPFSSDSNAKARVDQEHWANRIGRLFGFHQPETRIMAVGDSKYAYVQYIKPAKSDEGLLGMGPADLNDPQLIQAMQEHVLDWVIANHDSNERNLLLDPNDRDVIGIDKGQAFRFFGQDQLAVGYRPEVNGNPVWYDQFYEGVQKGTISKERADKITKAVLSRAWKVQRSHDDKYREMLESALDKRTEWPSEYPDKEAFIDALMYRKAHVFDSFLSLYQEIYSKSPYSFDFDPEKLKATTIADHVHITPSAEFAEDVKTAKTAGMSLIIPSEDIEDEHILFYTVQEGSTTGPTTLRAFFKLRKDADIEVTNWLKQHSVTHMEDAPSYSPPVADHKHLPMCDEWFAIMKSAAMTINHHSPNGGQQPDGEYNASTLNQLESAREMMESVKLSLTLHENKSPDKPFTYDSFTFVTKEQQKAFGEMLDTYLGEIKRINKCKEENIKVKPHVEKFIYTPSEGLKTDVFDPDAPTENKSKAAEIGSSWYDSLYATTWTKTDVDTWTSDEKEPSILGDVVMQQNIDAYPADRFIFHESDVEEISEGTAEIGAKVMSVKHTSAHGPGGHFDEDAQTFVYDKEDHGSGYKGYQYDIDYGPIQVSYSPWKGEDIPMSRRGLMTASVKDWDGSEQQIEDVLEILRAMKVRLPEADDQNLELFYWRHLFAVIQARKDANSTEYKALKKTYDQKFMENSGNWTPEVELESLRAAFAAIWGQDVVDNADYMPHFSRMHLATAKDGYPTGHPYWLRPDISLKQLRKEIHKVHHKDAVLGCTSIPGRLYKMGISGQLPAEERLRVLGFFEGGHYGTSYSDQENGGSHFVFARQGFEAGLHYNEPKVYYRPEVYLRTQNMAFPSDSYGNIGYLKDKVPFSIPKQLQFGPNDPSGNETDIKYGISFLDDVSAVFFSDESERSDLIAMYHKFGITELYGIPIEQIFVTTSADVNTALGLAWDDAIAREEQEKAS